MAKPKIVVKGKALEKIMKNSKALRDVQTRAGRIAAACGEGYVANTNIGPTRARGSVVTANAAAEEDNARNNTLIRNLDRGR